jgi:class 3 adenylate cyclase
MFCDLAESTRLSQELDPEVLREVVRAYQATAAEVIHQFAGHMARRLGDGLRIYVGWSVTHEDDAQRALHAGMGIVEAITMTLNPRLEQEKGGELTVRIGIHTGPMVVGEMGGGGRDEAMGWPVRRWEAPEDAFPSIRLVVFLADCPQPPLLCRYRLQTPQITLGSPCATRRHWKRI